MSIPAATDPVVPPAQQSSLDAYGAYSIAVTQNRLVEQIAMLIDDIALSLALDDEKRDTADRGNADADADNAAETASVAAPAGMSSLMSAGRRRETRAKERRLLAEDMLFSSLRNLDNPDWLDDDAGDTPDEHGDGAFLRALLQWNSLR